MNLTQKNGQMEHIIRHVIGFILLFLALPVGAQRHQIRRDGRVLAHSLRFDPSIVTDDMPEALQEMLRAYQAQSRYANRVAGKAVAPLLKSVRDQNDPYNRSCPYYTSEDGTVSTERCLTGCVATCIEQVLSYYRHPDVLTDTLHGWTTENYTIPDVLPGTRIDWDHILNDYRNGFTEQEAQAVSDLTFYCGIAVHMNWGLSSSSANLSRAFEPLWRAFGYQTIAFVPRAMYSTPAWNAMLRNELEHGRPICYTGHNMALSGHAFNIDGVDEEGYYHLNWGYGGDFDGYFDLDFLNPFETHDDATPLGQQEGLFSNQTALFMHPDDFVIDIHDTLTTEDAFAGVVVDNISFRRQPDTQGYTIADFSMTNQTQDSLNFTFEVLTYLPTDTAIFMQADYVGLSAVNLAPGERKTWPVYCQFSKTGERIFAFSADDETLPYQVPVTVKKGTAPRLSFATPEYRLLRFKDGLAAELSIDVTNMASQGYAGNLVTFCLFPEGSDEDRRHWDVLSLPGGETHRLTSLFRHLTDGQTYTLRVRCPWVVQQELTFTVRAEEATDGIGEVNVLNRPTDDAMIFDLSGRSHHGLSHGIVIRGGKKYLK